MSKALPLLNTRPSPSRFQSELLRPELLSELQASGLRWLDPEGSGLSRRGGAGPSDHKAIRLLGQVVMVPILNHAATSSPFSALPAGPGRATLYRGEQALGPLEFPKKPRFYDLSTSDGVPYWKIATLHADDVLATTVLQNCIRYADQRTSCQFCAIGKSLAARSTIPRKTPEQLAEVAAAAVRLDAVRHMVMTTGTPPGDDRGARILSESARAIRARVELPLQAQCEPPEDFAWFAELKASGVDTLGMHLEAVTAPVRARIMPGKAEVPLARYYEAFEAAVGVFGWGQVTTYILAGLGDPAADVIECCRRLVQLGVYPFVVPFVPIAGTPLEHHATPEPTFLRRLLDDVAEVIAAGGLSSQSMKAGCGRCGACSSLKSREGRAVRAAEPLAEVAHA
jgi:radical SAM protein (TIGR04043 family)